MRETGFGDCPRELQLAQQIALKAATDIATQAQFAAIDASAQESLHDAAKRFGAILHYAERALRALDEAVPASSLRNSVQ